MNPYYQTGQEGQWPLSMVELAKDWKGIQRLAPHLVAVVRSLRLLGRISLTSGLAFGVQSRTLISFRIPYRTDQLVVPESRKLF